MNEFLSTLLQAIIIAAVPICAGAIIKGVQAGAKYLTSRTENETAKKYLEDVADAISTAVTYTSQTYVDALKNSNKFTKENQEEALRMAVDKAATLMTAEARAFLEKAYGDLNAYLVSRIEAEVRVQKQQAGVITLGEPIAAISAETPDVTTVAATTAAATAAAVVRSTIPQTASTNAADSPPGRRDGPGGINSRHRRSPSPVGQETANVTAVKPPCRFAPACDL